MIKNNLTKLKCGTDFQFLMTKLIFLLSQQKENFKIFFNIFFHLDISLLQFIITELRENFLNHNFLYNNSFFLFNVHFCCAETTFLNCSLNFFISIKNEIN